MSPWTHISYISAGSSKLTKLCNEAIPRIDALSGCKFPLIICIKKRFGELQKYIYNFFSRITSIPNYTILGRRYFCRRKMSPIAIAMTVLSFELQRLKQHRSWIHLTHANGINQSCRHISCGDISCGKFT